MKKFIPAVFFALLFSASLFAQNDLKFKEASSEPHHYLIMVNPIADLGEFRASVTKYIYKSHAKDRLKISNIEIGKTSKTSVMLLKGFRDKAHAMAFHKTLTRERPDFMHLNMTKTRFAITEKNFEEIIRHQSWEEYEDFFNQYYQPRRTLRSKR